MSATGCALVQYVPVLSPLAPKTHWRYRAGVVMERLDRRRLLSADAGGELLDEAVLADECAIYVDDAALTEEEAADAELYYMTLELEDGGGEYVGEWEECWAEGDESEIYELTMVEEGDGEEIYLDDEEYLYDTEIESEGDGVDWPVGWGWTLDRLPTVEETDAAWNGDDLGGLWVPIRTFGGEDPIYKYDDLETTGEDGEYEPWIAYNMPGDGGPLDGETDPDLYDGEGVIMNFGGEVTIDDETVIFMTGAPTAAEGEPTGDEAQGPGGAPTPIEFAALSTDGILLGKLTGGVTDEEPSDLPFLN